MAIPQVRTSFLSSTSFTSPHHSPISPTSPPVSTMTSHFVQALHDYLPSNSHNEDVVSCLFFKKGSIIEVFNRDNSGWWDGQLGGVRGWFPSNYVGRIGEAVRSSADFEDDKDDGLELWRQRQPKMLDNVMMFHTKDDLTVSLEENTENLSPSTSMLIQTQVSEFAQDNNGTNLGADFQIANLIDEMAQKVSDLVDSYAQPLNANVQLNVFRVVSCVRSLLTYVNMVDKESPLLKIYPELSRQRKIVLSALSRLILKGKVLQSGDATLMEDQENEKNNNNITAAAKITNTTITTINNNNNNNTDYDNNTSDNNNNNNNNNQIGDLIVSPITPTPSSPLAEINNNNNTNGNTMDELDQISYLADRLLNEIDIFEKMITTIPHDTSSTTITTDTTARSSGFFQQNDTPRSSFSSSIEHIPTSRSSSTSSILLRQHITEARHSSTFNTLTGDIDHILQAILDHQTSIDELMANFLMTLERFLENKKKRAAEMLEITRRAVDAVRTFLSVVEYVCSNISDHRHSFVLDDNESSSELITLLLTKEYVYSSITNLVTAVRALTSTFSDEQHDFEHLEICCENVVHTTNECAACVRICLEGMKLYELSLFHSSDSLSDYKQLSVLGKKASSLKALQQYHQLSGLPEEEQHTEIHQYRKELRDSIKSVDSGILRQQQQQIKPSISDSAIQTSFCYSGKHVMATRPRATSLDSRSPSQLSKISKHPMAAAFPLPPAVTNGVKVNTQDGTTTTNNSVLSEDDQVKKKEMDYTFLRQRVFSDDEMTFNTEGEVTGGTIEALVRKLTLHEKSPDLIFTRAFFYNFRVFTSPDVFIELLKKRFAVTPPDELDNDEQLTMWNNRVLLPIRLRVYNVIKTWLENYFNFEQDAGVENVLLEFAAGEMESVMPGPAKRMVELINKTFSSKGLTSSGRKHAFLDTRLTTTNSPLASHMTKTNPFPSLNTNNHISLGSGTGSLFSSWSISDNDFEKPPASIITRSLRNSLRKALHQNTLHLVHVNDIDPVELARQITIMENNLFCRIRPSEMIGQEFKKRSGKSTAIHVKAMIQRSTQITNWVCDTILKEMDTKKRVQMLKYWIKVGDACLQLNNYNTLMAIRSALDSTSIIRLRKTWDHLSAKYKSLWEPIHRATDSQRNFAEYRQRLKTAVAPCLPFLGVYLTDLTFINDGNPDFRVSPSDEQKKLINFDKYIKVTRVLSDIDQFQIGYKFLEIDEIQTYISRTLELVEMDDQVLYTLSLKREPKEDHLDP